MCDVAVVLAKTNKPQAMATPQWEKVPIINKQAFIKQIKSNLSCACLPLSQTISCYSTQCDFANEEMFTSDKMSGKKITQRLAAGCTSC